MEHCKCTPYIQLAKFPDPIPTTLATITTTDADLPSSVGIILTSLQKLQPDHVLYYKVQTKVLMRGFSIRTFHAIMDLIHRFKY